MDMTFRWAYWYENQQKLLIRIKELTFFKVDE